MNPYFSIIMASTLANYKHAAKDRDKKIHRAIKSALTQTFTNFELFIVADGCEKTFEVAKQYSQDSRVKCSLIQKQPYMSGKVRNFGIVNANGDWILYLDNDDYFGENHLQIIHDAIFKTYTNETTNLLNVFPLKEPKWIYFNDYAYKNSKFYEREVNINAKHKHGTGNIAHKKDIGVLWKNSSYDHDFIFVNELKKHSPFYKIETPEYYVCHVPNSWDV